ADSLLNTSAKSAYSGPFCRQPLWRTNPPDKEQAYQPIKSTPANQLMPPGSYAGALNRLGSTACGPSTPFGRAPHGPPKRGTNRFAVPRTQHKNMLRIYPGDTPVRAYQIKVAMEEQLGITPGRYTRYRSGTIEFKMRDGNNGKETIHGDIKINGR